MALEWFEEEWIGDDIKNCIWKGDTEYGLYNC